MPAYDKSAEIYDAIYHFKNYGADVAYVLKCIQDKHPRARTLLDVACGTGNHIGALSQAHEVEGLDLSDSMLAQARRKFPATTFHRGSMMDFDLGRNYDVVACLFRSIAYVKTLENFHAAIGAMSRHVAPGGLLLIEPFFTPDTYWVDRVTLNEVNEPELKIAWMYVSERQGNVGVMNTHYLVGRPEGVEHFTELHEMGLFSRTDYADAFAAAGMELEYDPKGPTGVGFYIGRKGA